MTIAVTCTGGLIASLFHGTFFALAQTTKPAAEQNSGETKSAAAKEFFGRVRQELPNHQSIKADLYEAVSIGDQNFKVEGEYLSTGKKLRLTYQLRPEQGVQAKMLEVCDGKELWTQLEVSDSIRVTRRNVQQILAAAVAASKRDVPEVTINVELGLGGLVALFASLERTMEFDALKDEEVDGQTRTIVQGRWKKEIFERYPKDKDGSLPVFIPDLVRIVVDPQTLFPEKVLYLKKQPGKKSFRSLVALEFRNVQFDVPVEDKEFVFQLPPGTNLEDVTKQYVDRLSGVSASAAADGNSPAGAAASKPAGK